MLDDKIIEDLILWECSHDEAYWKHKKKHHFSVRYRKKHRDYVRELYRRGIDGETTGSSRKIVRFGRTGNKFARIAAAACIAVAALTAVHVTAKNVHLDKMGGSVLQDFDDHVQFSEEDNRPKIVKWLDGKQDAGENSTAQAETTFEKKMPRELPEGYELVQENYNQFSEFFSQGYTDSNEHYLYYNQYKTMDNTGMTSNGEAARTVQINGQEGLLSADEDTLTLVWTDDTYYYCLNGNLDEETLIQIAVNVN